MPRHVKFGGGADATECVGTEATVEQAIASHGGRMGFVGVHYKNRALGSTLM